MIDYAIGQNPSNDLVASLFGALHTIHNNKNQFAYIFVKNNTSCSIMDLELKRNK